MRRRRSWKRGGPSAADYFSRAYSALASFRVGDVGIGIFPEREEISVRGEAACNAVRAEARFFLFSANCA